MRERQGTHAAPEKRRSSKTGPGFSSDGDPDGWGEADTALVMRRGEPWVERMARSLVRRLGLGPDHVEELRAAGRLGLLEAHRQFDRHHPSRAKFSTFAYRIVRRHVHDAVSAVRNISPGIHQSAKKKAAARRAGRPESAQVYTEDFLLPLLRLGAEGMFEDRFLDPGRELEGRVVREAIERLPDPQQRQVLRLMYVHGLEQSTVGEALGLGKSRVSRIRKAGLETLEKLLVIGNALEDRHVSETLQTLGSDAHRDVLAALYESRLDYAKAREHLGLNAGELEALHQTGLGELVAACIDHVA